MEVCSHPLQLLEICQLAPQRLRNVNQPLLLVYLHSTMTPASASYLIFPPKILLIYLAAIYRHCQLKYTLI